MCDALREKEGVCLKTLFIFYFFTSSLRVCIFPILFYKHLLLLSKKNSNQVIGSGDCLNNDYLCVCKLVVMVVFIIL